jgi:hypothetical protein
MHRLLMVLFADRRRGTLLILALGLCLYVFHLLHSNLGGFASYITWTADSQSHFDYVRRVATEGLPRSYECWECFQPPLYYLIAAPLYYQTELADPLLAVRLLSLAFYVGFLLFAIRLLAMEIRPLAPYYAALCLIVFWPYGVITSSMISNDLPLYTMQAAGFYYVMRWRREPSVSLLALAVLACGIASGFKLNGLLIGGFIALVFLHESHRDRALLRQLWSKPVVLCLLVGLVLVGASFARTYYDLRLANVTDISLLVSNVHALVRDFPVPNDKLEYFVLPHVQRYLASPFLEQGRAPLEMNYFINFVLKSSLYSAPAWRAVGPAYAMNFLSLAMLGYLIGTLANMAIAQRHKLMELLPLSIFVGLQLSALIVYRLVHPHTGNQNFRFIYLVLIAMAVLYAHALIWHHERGRTSIFGLGMLLPLAFSSASALFFFVDSRL